MTKYYRECDEKEAEYVIQKQPGVMQDGRMVVVPYTPTHPLQWVVDLYEQGVRVPMVFDAWDPGYLSAIDTRNNHYRNDGKSWYESSCEYDVSESAWVAWPGGMDNPIPANVKFQAMAGDGGAMDQAHQKWVWGYAASNNVIAFRILGVKE